MPETSVQAAGIMRPRINASSNRILIVAGLFIQLAVIQPTLAATLPMLIEETLASHPTVRGQRALQRSADEDLKAAEWKFYPTPSISVEQGVEASSGSVGQALVLGVQQPLWTGGRLTAGVEKAMAGVRLSQASIVNSQQELALRVVQAYADWYGSALRVRAFGKSRDVHERLGQQIQRRIAQGMSPESDLLLLRARADQLNADLAAARTQQAAALVVLSQLSGVKLQYTDLGDLDKVGVSRLPALGPVNDLIQRAIIENPVVRRMLAQADVYQAEIAERKSALFPEAYLRVERRHNSAGLAQSSKENRIFIGVSSNFGPGLSSMSQIGGAKARYQSALEDIESVRKSLTEQILLDHARIEDAGVRLVALVASMKSSEDISAAWARQFLAGRKSWLDVMNAARELAQVEVQIGDLTASQFLLSWRMSIVVKGVEATTSNMKPAPATPLSSQ